MLPVLFYKHLCSLFAGFYDVDTLREVMSLGFTLYGFQRLNTYSFGGVNAYACGLHGAFYRNSAVVGRYTQLDSSTVDGFNAYRVDYRYFIVGAGCYNRVAVGQYHCKVTVACADEQVVCMVECHL